MVQSNTKPSNYRIKGNKVIFMDNLVEKEVVNESTEEIEIMYQYDEYELELSNRTDLHTYVESNYDKMFEFVKNKQIEDLTEYKKNKISILSQTCGEIIDNGITLDGKQYSAKLEDQMELLATVSSIESKVSVINNRLEYEEITEEEAMNLIMSLTTSWHSNSEACEVWNAMNFIEFANKIQEHVTWNKTYLGGLKELVNRKRTTESIDEIYYGIDLPEDLLENVMNIIEAMK